MLSSKLSETISCIVTEYDSEHGALHEKNNSFVQILRENLVFISSDSAKIPIFARLARLRSFFFFSELIRAELIERLVIRLTYAALIYAR